MNTTRKTKVQVLRDEIHQIVDDLPSKELHDAKKYLVYLRSTGDPFLRKLMEAPWTDEPLSEEDAKRVDEAWDEIARGGTFTNEEMRTQLGLCPKK